MSHSRDIKDENDISNPNVQCTWISPLGIYGDVWYSLIWNMLTYVLLWEIEIDRKRPYIRFEWSDWAHLWIQYICSTMKLWMTIVSYTIINLKTRTLQVSWNHSIHVLGFFVFNVQKETQCYWCQTDLGHMK